MSDVNETDGEAPSPEPDAPRPPIIYRAEFSSEGLPLGFYPSDVWPSGYPEGAVVITEEQWQDFLTHQGERRWDGEKVVPYTPPAPPLPPVVITADVLFFERMTDVEYDDLDASVKTGETARIYRGWSAATVFEEGTAMWALLAKHLGLTVTADRKAELLARP